MVWAFLVIYYVCVLTSQIVSFGCMNKDYRVLVPLKKILTLYFARTYVYCSLGPLMFGMTTLVPSVNFYVDGFSLLKELCRAWLSCRTL